MPRWAKADPAAVPPIRELCDALIGIMRAGRTTAFAQRIYDIVAPAIKVAVKDTVKLKPQDPSLTPYVGRAITSERVGESSQGRPLHLYKFGNGPKRVLFWFFGIVLLIAGLTIGAALSLRRPRQDFSE